MLTWPSPGGVKQLELRTDSATVCRWLDDALSGRARLRTKACSEMLIRRRIGVIQQLVEEFGLEMTTTLVTSEQNPADRLTRVPKKWLREVEQDKGRQGDSAVAAAAADEQLAVDPEQIRAIHDRTGHQGIRRTLWYARRDLNGRVTRAAVREVVEHCDVCQSIDPAPKTWRHGKLSVSETWERLAIDVTHFRNRSYLTIIDCGPSRYALWRQLHRHDAGEVVARLEDIFLERGAPRELLLDNATEFRGRCFAAFAARWGVKLHFRGAHEPTGNGVIERHHRTVKVMAARQGCTVGEAVHRYNLTPRDGVNEDSAPAAGVFQRTGRDLPTQAPVQTDEEPVEERLRAPYRIGDRVWVRRRQAARCTDKSKRGTVTRVLSDQLVEVDGTPWHVRSVRRRYESEEPVRGSESAGDDLYDFVVDVGGEEVPMGDVDYANQTSGIGRESDEGGSCDDREQSIEAADDDEGASETVSVMPRRSERKRKAPEEIYGESVPSEVIDDL